MCPQKDDDKPGFLQQLWRDPRSFVAPLVSNSSFWSKRQQDPNSLCVLNSATVAMVTPPCSQPVENSELQNLFSHLRRGGRLLQERRVLLHASHRQESVRDVCDLGKAIPISVKNFNLV